MSWMYAPIMLMGYLSGGILFSYHLPMWIKGIDITRISPDGNPGGSNAVKFSGVPIGLLCIALDLLKGFLPVRIGMLCLNVESTLFAGVMLAPVLGHATAPFYRKICGGKAIAVSFGVLLALVTVSDSFWVLAALYIFFSVVMVIRPNERRTVVVFGMLALWALISRIRRQAGIALGCVMVSGVVMWKNRRVIPVGQQKCEKAIESQ